MLMHVKDPVAPGALAGDWELTTTAGEVARLEELAGRHHSRVASVHDRPLAFRQRYQLNSVPQVSPYSRSKMPRATSRSR